MYDKIHYKLKKINKKIKIKITHTHKKWTFAGLSHLHTSRIITFAENDVESGFFTFHPKSSESLLAAKLLPSEPAPHSKTTKPTKIRKMEKAPGKNVIDSQCFHLKFSSFSWISSSQFVFFPPLVDFKSHKMFVFDKLSGFTFLFFFLGRESASPPHFGIKLGFTNDSLSCLLWVIFYWFFACLASFNWMPNIVNFTLLGAR